MATNSVQGLVNNGAGSVSNAPLSGANPLPVHKGGTSVTSLPELAEALGFEGGSLTGLVDDESPALGGDLDCNGNDLTDVGNVTLADGSNIIVNTTTGTKIGTAVGQKIGFWNATPIVQRASDSQAAVVGTAATNSTPYGYSQAQADAIVTLVNELRAALVAVGIIKGSA